MSNEFNTYYYDNDGDNLGGELASAYLCSDDAEEDWVLNNDDLDDGCTSNEYADYCVDGDGDGHSDALSDFNVCTDS